MESSSAAGTRCEEKGRHQSQRVTDDDSDLLVGFDDVPSPTPQSFTGLEECHRPHVQVAYSNGITHLILVDDVESDYRSAEEANIEGQQSARDHNPDKQTHQTSSLAQPSAEADIIFSTTRRRFPTNKSTAIVDATLEPAEFDSHVQMIDTHPNSTEVSSRPFDHYSTEELDGDDYDGEPKERPPPPRTRRSRQFGMPDWEQVCGYVGNYVASVEPYFGVLVFTHDPLNVEDKDVVSHHSAVIKVINGSDEKVGYRTKLGDGALLYLTPDRGILHKFSWTPITVEFLGHKGSCKGVRGEEVLLEVMRLDPTVQDVSELTPEMFDNAAVTHTNDKKQYLLVRFACVCDGDVPSRRIGNPNELTAAMAEVEAAMAELDAAVEKMDAEREKFVVATRQLRLLLPREDYQVGGILGHLLRNNNWMYVLLLLGALYILFRIM